MENSIFVQMGGTYRQEGDYFLPNLTIPASVSVGVWGQRHLQYIREYRKALYFGLQLSGKLNSYLADIDRQAVDMFSQLVKQMSGQEGITEQLKEDNPMGWVQRMNNIQVAAVEIVNKEIIYT